MRVKETLGQMAGAMTATADAHLHLAKMAQAAMGEHEEGSDEHSAFRTTMDVHATAAEKCAEAAKSIVAACKAAESDELAPLPTGFSKVHGDAPPQTRTRLVARFGSPPPIQTASSDSIAAEIFHREKVEP